MRFAAGIVVLALCCDDHASIHAINRQAPSILVSLISPGQVTGPSTADGHNNSQQDQPTCVLLIISAMEAYEMHGATRPATGILPWLQWE